MDERPMEWERFVAAAQEIGWVTYIGTAGADGRPHVAVVAPGFTDQTMWFATRVGTRKLRNIEENPAVSFHWSVGGDGPGELFARGTAQIHSSAGARARLWEAGVLSYDPAGFFGSADNPGFVFVEVAVTYASLVGPGHVRNVWRRDPGVARSGRRGVR